MEFRLSREDMAQIRCPDRKKIQAAIVLWAVVYSASIAWAITPDDPGPAAIRFTLNSGQDVKPISPYIYGSNSDLITNRTFVRSGGNRLTGYNWETNASNAGRLVSSQRLLPHQRPGKSAARRRRERDDSERRLRRPGRANNDTNGGVCQRGREWNR